jgi:hypothetical protein
MWHVDPMLDNNHETNNKATSRKQQQRNGVFCAVHDEVISSPVSDSRVELVGE